MGIYEAVFIVPNASYPKLMKEIQTDTIIECVNQWRQAGEVHINELKQHLPEHWDAWLWSSNAYVDYSILTTYSATPDAVSTRIPVVGIESV